MTLPHDRHTSRRLRSARAVATVALVVGSVVALAAPASAATRVSITAAPKSATNSRTATLRWTKSPARLAVSCRIDSKPFATCSGTSKTFTKLKDGKHTFQLRFKKNGKNVTVSKSWKVDTVKPTGGFISVSLQDFFDGPAYVLSLGEGTDAGTGIATWVIRKRSSSLANGACGTFGAATSDGPPKPVPPIFLDDLPDNGCLRHELVVTDKAGNSRTYLDTFNGPILRDSTPPIVVLNTIASPNDGQVTVSGTVSDPQSGIRRVRVTSADDADDPSNGATECTVNDPGSTWSCDANLLDGTFVVAAIATNNANVDGVDLQTNVRVRGTDPEVAVFCELCFTATRAIEGRHPLPANVLLEAPPFEDVTVTFTADADITVSPSTLTFTPENWDTEQSIVVTAVDDATVESDEVHSLVATTASTDTGYQGVTDSMSYTILDNDSPRVFLATTNFTGTVREGGLTATRQVSLGKAPTSNVTVTLASDKGGLAFSPTTLTFTPANFATPQTVTISAIDDDTIEGSITHAVTATSASSDPSYSGVVSASTSITENIDNDVATVTFTLSGFTNEVTEGGSGDTFQVKLGSAPAANVTIAFSTDSDCAADITFTPTSLTFTPANGKTNQTVTLAAVNDAVDEGFFQTCPLDGAITTTDPVYAGITNIGTNVTVIDND